MWSCFLHRRCSASWILLGTAWIRSIQLGTVAKSAATSLSSRIGCAEAAESLHLIGRCHTAPWGFKRVARAALRPAVRATRGRAPELAARQRCWLPGASAGAPGTLTASCRWLGMVECARRIRTATQARARVGAAATPTGRATAARHATSVAIAASVRRGTKGTAVRHASRRAVAQPGAQIARRLAAASATRADLAIISAVAHASRKSQPVRRAQLTTSAPVESVEVETAAI